MDDDEFEPSQPGLGRRTSSRPPRPNTARMQDLGYEDPKKSNKLKTSKEIKAKCDQILNDIKEQILDYNSNFPFSVKLFDPAIFDRMSKKLLSNEYKNTYEFALDIRNNMSAGFG